MSDHLTPSWLPTLSFAHLSIVAFIYYLVHRILLRRPDLLWSSVSRFTTKGQPSPHPLLQVKTIAHRGGRETTVENTLHSFRNAYAHNMNMIELDVHLTLDKQVVVFHDGDFPRMCCQEGHVNTTNKKDLPLLFHDPTWDKRQNQSENGGKGGKGTAGLPIPLFREVLASLPEGVCVLVEIKNTSPAITQELVEKTDVILKEYPELTHRILWFSLHSHTCDVLLPKQNPDRLRIASARDVSGGGGGGGRFLESCCPFRCCFLDEHSLVFVVVSLSICRVDQTDGVDDCLVLVDIVALSANAVGIDGGHCRGGCTVVHQHWVVASGGLFCMFVGVNVEDNIERVRCVCACFCCGR